MITSHRGYFDCFADRNTVEHELAAIVEEKSTGLGPDVDFWCARALLCDDVEVLSEAPTDIARIPICQGMQRTGAKHVSRFHDKYGETFDQAKFVQVESAARGLIEKPVAAPNGQQ